MLEWQFQKRLQESKQSDEDEEEEDDEDMDAMLIMQRLEAEKRARVRTDKQTVGRHVSNGGKQDFVLEEEVPLCHVRRLSGSIKPDFCFFQAALPISSKSRNKSAALRSRKGESREN